MQFMKESHQLSTLRYKLQTEPQASNRKKQQSKECTPTKTDVKVEEAASASFVPFYLKALAQLLSVFRQKNKYTTYQDEDKEQCGIGDYKFANRSHHETCVKLGDIGEKISFCRCTIRSVLGRKLANSLANPFFFTRFYAIDYFYALCVWRNDFWHFKRISYLIFEYECSSRQANEYYDNSQRQGKPQMKFQKNFLSHYSLYNQCKESGKPTI